MGNRRTPNISIRWSLNPDRDLHVVYDFGDWKRVHLDFEVAYGVPDVPRVSWEGFYNPCSGDELADLICGLTIAHHDSLRGKDAVAAAYVYLEVSLG